MVKNPLVSVVILNYNKRNATLKSISSVIGQTYKNYEIIVVDDSSTDDTVAQVRRKFPEVRLVSLKKSLGRSAHNEGFKRARGQILVPLDSDMYLSRGFLAKLVEKFNRFPKLSALAFDLKDPTGKTVGWPPVYSPSDKLGGGYECGSGFPAIRHEVFENVGGFNPSFFLYVDEWEYFARLLKYGYKVYYFPDIVGYHTSPPHAYKSIMRGYHVVKNHLQLYAIYLPVRVWPKFLFHHSKEFSRVVVKGEADRWGTVRGLIFGLWFFLRALPKRQVLKGQALEKFLRFYFPKKGEVIVGKWGWNIISK